MARRDDKNPRKFFGKGDVIYRAGDAAEELYVLETGRVELTKSFRGVETIVDLLGPGDSFGESALLVGTERPDSARALEDTRLVVFSAKDGGRGLSSKGDTLLQILKCAVRRLSHLDTSVEALLSRDRHTRTLFTLSALADEQGAIDWRQARPVEIGHDRLADLTGLDEENLRLVIAELGQAGVLQRTEQSSFKVSSRTKIDGFLDSQARLTRRVRVMLVDDSSIFRKIVQQMLEGYSYLEIVATAQNGAEALEKVKRFRPDVVIMDVQMPGMTGIEAVQQIMAECPTPILVMTSLAKTYDGSLIFEALRAGAVDLWPKPDHPPPWTEEAELLAGYLLEFSSVKVTRSAPPPPSEEIGNLPEPGSGPCRIGIVAGVGGLRLLARMLAELPKDFGGQILLVQHNSSAGAERLAQWYDRQGHLQVQVAQQFEPFAPGTMRIAPEGHHMTVTIDGQIMLQQADDSDGFVPSAGPLFESLAQVDGERSVGLVLTGTTVDGLSGLQTVRKVGGLVLVQHPGDALADGMPRTVMERVSGCRTVTQVDMPGLLSQLVQRK